MDDLPRRKSVRLPEYDYAQNGAYFVTVCTAQRKHCLSTVGAGFPGPSITLAWRGRIVNQYIGLISEKYPSVVVSNFVIMPDHIHPLLEFRHCGPGNPAPTLGNVMGWFKYQTTKEINSFRSEKTKLWQRSYYEHVIRSREDYLSCWEYIANTPAKWAKIQNS